MPKKIVQYDLLISCPGDITSEISIIEDAVSQFNTQFSDALGISIRTKHWRKNSYAQSGGKPQVLLNEQFVNDCDAAVAILWTRFGTPTDEYGSGTEEEVEIMLSSGKQVFMYFSDKPLSPSQMDEESYKKVQAFRKKYKDRGIYFTYSSNEEFQKLFFAHLSQHFLSEKKVAEVKNERHSILKIMGIDQNQRLIGDAQLLKFIPNVEMTSDQYVKKIRGLFDTIATIHLEKQVESVDSSPLLRLSLSNPVEISKEEQKIINLVAERLKINVPEDFFDLGGLRRSAIPMNMFGEGSLDGTEEERGKYKEIEELSETISECVKWNSIESSFLDMKCIKLALQNSGTDIDEDIEISLRIPQKSLLLLREFPEFDDRQIGYLLNECNMDEIFGICSTSEYSDYTTSIKNQHFIPFTPRDSAFSECAPDNSDDFTHELANVFCYSCFNESDEYIVKIKFDYIKHNTTIAFPTVIFIKEPFGKIVYTITSKNSPEIISGEIQVVKE